MTQAALWRPRAQRVKAVHVWRERHEQHLEEILSVRVARKVAQDHTVSWDGHRWGVVRGEVCAGLRGAAVEIRTASGWKPLVALPRAPPAPAPLSRAGAAFRNPKTKANPNTMCLQSTLGEDHGSGHFYLAKNRTFLLCVDTKRYGHKTCGRSLAGPRERGPSTTVGMKAARRAKRGSSTARQQKALTLWLG